ncbi:MAG TPA: ATP-binding protein [Gemmatimonadaceae bacterium]|nr:ATP-binding protein [Gemmatimonadaceae bacterium]
MAKAGAGVVPASDPETKASSARRDSKSVLLRQGQQAAAAELGLRAIAGVPLDDLYGFAVELVHDAMQADFVYVVQLREGNELVVRAHVGRTDMNPVGRVLQAKDSIADFVIRNGEPVITPDFAVEERYTAPPAVKEVAARSAAAVPVHGRHGPFGSLVVMNRAPYDFQPEDIAFLQTAANVLAAAVDRSADGSALRRQQELFRAITEYGRELVVILSGNGTLTYVSPSGARMLGTDPLTLVGQQLTDLVHEADREAVTTAIAEAARDPNAMRAFSTRARKENGDWIHIAGTAYNMLHHSAVQGIVINARDVTEMVEAQEALHRSQEQLHQALKMEAVGRLAGGIAHDFNNLLTAIRGYSDMLAAGLRPGDPMRGDVQEIQRAAERAASLTHQLLAFSRRQVLRPDRLDLGLVVRDLENMVRRLIGEDIELTVTSEATRTVLVDRGQLEQVILNLAINSRDAMPSGGELTIETRDHDVPPSAPVRDGSPPPGRYAVVRVEDSGTGIPADIMDRVFEPFFTTKGQGKGTGLGLSTAYGIVKQSGGFIEVTSVEGAGTTFRIYLPEAEQPEVRASDSGAAGAFVNGGAGGETILLVEDADAVRHVVRRSLVKMGYRVLEASNGPQAIGVALEHADEIDLLLTDFVMPHMGGRELIDRLHELRLRPRILIMSGYIDDALLRGGGFPPGAAFIEKPFTAESIGRKVREVLDGAAPNPAPSSMHGK